MNGKDLFLGMNYVNRKYIEEAGKEPEEKKAGKYAAPKSGRIVMKKALLVAAMIATMLILMGAAVYTHWSSSMQRQFQPSENAKQQAEKSGLSVMYEESKPEDGSVLTATDQGITVTVVQTIVDQREANIVLRVEGFTPPEGFGVYPNVWQETATTLDGNEHFACSTNVDFDDGIVYQGQGKYTYTDGTPAEENGEGFQKPRCIREDGSMELVIHYAFSDTSGVNLGKELALHLTGFGIRTDTGKAEATWEKLVDGHWDLCFPLTGSDDTIKITPNVRLTDNATLTEAEVGQITVKALYQLDTYQNDEGTWETVAPEVAGVKLKDGTLIQLVPASAGYQDREKLIYAMEFRPFESMIEMDQVESLAFYDGWENDENGKPTIPRYKYIPVS